MSGLENELQVANWLSIVSFDLHKYIGAGGEIIITADEGGLAVKLLGVRVDDSRLHRKFGALLKNAVGPADGNYYFIRDIEDEE